MGLGVSTKFAAGQEALVATSVITPEWPSTGRTMVFGDVRAKQMMLDEGFLALSALPKVYHNQRLSISVNENGMTTV